MIDPFPRPATGETAVPLTSPTLFAWSGGGIVLLGERSEGRWVVARGWLEGDQLRHVRRWSFAAPGPFAGQVRRLVAEATGDLLGAGAAGVEALAWADANR